MGCSYSKLAKQNKLKNFVTIRAIRERFRKHIDYDKNSIGTSPESILKHGVPTGRVYLKSYSSFVLAYDQSKKTPIWVAELLTKDSMRGVASRKTLQFRSDPDVPKIFRSSNSDYLGSGWSRGHMASAGNNKKSQAAMDDTFFLTNVVPQNMEQNAGFWYRFEIFCRDLTRKFDEVRVISGPVMIPRTSAKGKKYITYQVIGSSEVAVPTHVYKVIAAENTNKQRALGAFVIPNKPLGHGRKLVDYQVEITELEKRTGVVFFPNMDTSEASNLSHVVDCQLMSKCEFDTYFLITRLKNVKSIERLEKLWTCAQEKNIRISEEVLSVYLKRRTQLETDE